MADLEGTALAFQWGEQAPSAHVYLAPAVLKFLRQRGARRVLDLGCGNGTFTARIVEAGYEVVGVDASASGIKIATRLVPAATFLEGSLEHPLPQTLRGQFDAVTAVEVIEHLPKPGVLCARAREALRPMVGGHREHPVAVREAVHGHPLRQSRGHRPDHHQPAGGS